MRNSLQDQLLKAGLVDKNKAQQVSKERRKKARQQQSGKDSAATDEDRQRQNEKATRDRELNQKRNEARRQREIAAQITQLVTRHRLPRSNSDDDRPFYFNNKGKVKKMYVSEEMHTQITTKKVAIVNCNGVFELVPADVAEKIRQRNPGVVIELPEEQEVLENDPYADYKVPDDLMW
ncbi:MAG: DUF2058 domain-containing protein [Candidatus Thiodiazotropha sp.]